VRAQADVIRGGSEARPVPAPLGRGRPGGALVRRADPVSGDRVLTLTALYLRYWIGWPSDAAADAVALWVAHALARGDDDTLLWQATPRLLLTSAENGAGKSSALDMIGYLCGSTFGRMPKVTGPAFAAVMGQFREVALLDEARLVCGTSARSQELQGMILAGYTRGARALVMRGAKATAADLFGPVAFAGRDDMLGQDGNTALTDLLARSITVRMTRPPRHYPEAGEAARQQGRMLGAALTAWTTAERGALTDAARALADDTAGQEVSALDTGVLRREQIWRPLLACATVADGEWPERVRAAQAELTGTTRAAEAEAVMSDLEALGAVWAAGSE
jgi:hypothetical protein